jgi:hypothetical protein
MSNFALLRLTQGLTMLPLLWLTKEVPVLLFCGSHKRLPVLALPWLILIQEVPDLALLWLSPEVPVLTLLRLTEMVKVLTLLRLTQEVPVPTLMRLTQEVPLAVEHISSQVCIFVLQLQIHLGKKRRNCCKLRLLQKPITIKLADRAVTDLKGIKVFLTDIDEIQSSYITNLGASSWNSS